MEPINYGIEKTATPQGFAGGLQLGNAIYQMNQQKMLDYQQAQAQQKAQQAALLIQQQRNEALNQHATNPTFETSVRIAALYPKDQAEAISNATKTWSDEKKTNTAGQMIGIQTALTKNPEIGMKLLNDYYEALKNSGDEGQAQYIDMVRKTAEQNPNLASSMLIGPAASIVGVDKYSQFQKNAAETDLLSGQDKREQQKVDVDATYKKGLLEVQRLEAKIKAQQASIENFRAQTERMNAGTAKESNLIKLQELQMSLQDKLDAREKLKRENLSNAENAIGGFDSTIDTVLKLRDHPGFESLFGVNLVPGTNSFIPGTEAAGAKTIFEQLQSKGFLAEIEKMKGLGALSENEGKKLGAAVVALSPGMPEKDAKIALNDIIKTMSVAKERAAKKYGVKPPAPVSSGVKPTVSGW